MYAEQQLTIRDFFNTNNLPIYSRALICQRIGIAYVNLPISIAFVYLGWNSLTASASRKASRYLSANKS